jgi:hypothetical protein
VHASASDLTIAARRVRDDPMGSRHACVVAFAIAACRSAAPTPTPAVSTVERTGPVAIVPVAPGPGPIDVPAARLGHAAAQSRLLPREPPLPPLLFVADTAGDDGPLARFIPIADPGAERRGTDPPAAPALAPFHAALRALADGPRDRVRIAMYGASGTAADIGTAYVRTYLQARFGVGGPGFVPLVPLGKWYRHNEVDVRASKGWTVLHAQRAGGEDGRFGVLGAAFVATRAGAWAEVAGKADSAAAEVVTRIELHALAQPKGGRVRVRIDGRVQDTIATAAAEPTLLVREYAVPRGRHVVRVETLDRADVRVFGLVLEGDRGVVVDTLGIDGTRAANHLRWDAAIWSDAVHRRAYDLVTLSYGTNESVDEDEPIERLRIDMGTVVERVRRELPDATCVLLGPGDFPKRAPHGLQPRPRLLEIAAIERDLAAIHRCGFWDGMAFMGGPGAMARWVAAAPSLARDDHLHFRRRGSATLGQALCDALMMSYDADGTARSPTTP